MVKKDMYKGVYDVESNCWRYKGYYVHLAIPLHPNWDDREGWVVHVERPSKEKSAEWFLMDITGMGESAAVENAYRYIDMMSRQLCFVENGWAWFTPDLEKETGNDWNDAPYQVHAGEPFGMAHLSGESNPLTRVAFHAPCIEEACESGSFSVDQINNIHDKLPARVPWIKRTSNVSGDQRIYAGATLAEFLDVFVGEIGGKVYFESEAWDVLRHTRPA